MRTERFIGTLLLLFGTTIFTGCAKNNYPKSKIQTIKLYISAQTSTSWSWESDAPIECMLVKEEGQTRYWKMGFNEINGFVYEIGREYTLSVEKKKLSNPPADASDTVYKLIKILSQRRP